MPSRSLSFCRTAALLAAVCLAAALPADAQEPPPPTAVTLEGWTVSIDAKSREPRPPTDQELARLRAELEAMLEELSAVFEKGGTIGEHPGGGTYYVSPVHLHDTLFVRVDGDGGYHAVCSEPENLPQVFATSLLATSLLATPAPPNGAPLR